MPPPQAGNGSAYCEVGQFAHDGGMRLRSSSNDPTAVTAQSARKPVLVRSQGVVAERVELQAAGIDPAESEKAYSPCINAQAKKKPSPRSTDARPHNEHQQSRRLLRHLGAQQARALGERLAA
jgi:hypothetical protein